MNRIFFSLLLIAAGTGTAYVLLNASGNHALSGAPRTVAGIKIAAEGGAPSFAPGVNCDQFTDPGQHQACLETKRNAGPGPFAGINCDTLTNPDQKEACRTGKMITSTSPGTRPPEPRDVNCDTVANPIDKAVCFSKKFTTTGPQGRPVINCDQFTTVEQKAACLVVNQKIQMTAGSSTEKINPCHELPDGPKRAECARAALGFATNTPANVQVPCVGATSTARAECERGAKDKLKSLVLFQVEDLIHRAQTASSSVIRGPVRTSVVSALQKAKTDLNKATTLAARTALLNKIRATWKNFTARTNSTTLKTDNLNAAFSDVKQL